MKGICGKSSEAVSICEQFSNKYQKKKLKINRKDFFRRNGDILCFHYHAMKNKNAN